MFGVNISWFNKKKVSYEVFGWSERFFNKIIHGLNDSFSEYREALEDIEFNVSEKFLEFLGYLFCTVYWNWE
jgi:hypothetical protein